MPFSLRGNALERHAGTVHRFVAPIRRTNSAAAAAAAAVVRYCLDVRPVNE
jgi:hypothetical protein